ncbi:MAG: hypothetical protein AB7F66_17680 [Bacteriovoracia bacterium]
MSWYTDFRDSTLSQLGLGTGSEAVKTLSTVAKNAIGTNNVTQEPPQVQANPLNPSTWTMPAQIAGISLPVLALIAGGAYFLFRKKGR